VEVYMGNPTPKQPIVVNADGSVSMLVYLARTFDLSVVVKGLMSTTGYKSRFGFTDKYGNALLASATSEDGSITFSPALDPLDGVTQIGTRVRVIITDEDMDFTAKGGKVDHILEQPDGAEQPIVVGDWVAWNWVTP
jgi:hypothetical protein